MWLLTSITAQERSVEIRARVLASLAPPLPDRTPSQGAAGPDANPALWPRAATAELDPAPGHPPRPGRGDEYGPLVTERDPGPESLAPDIVTGASTGGQISPGVARGIAARQDTELDVASLPTRERPVPGGSAPVSQESDAAAALDFVLIVATHPQRAVTAVDLDAAAARLRPGGILVVVTDRHREGARLTDPRPAVVVAAQRAGLDYLQHIVTVLPPRPWRTLGPDLSVFRHPEPPHSTRAAHDPPADTAAPDTAPAGTTPAGTAAAGTAAAGTAAEVRS